MRGFRADRWKVDHALAACVVLLIASCEGGDRPAGQIEGRTRPPATLTAQAQAQRSAIQRLVAREQSARALPAKRILFGDLHAHTTYSLDAFLWSLPLVGGEGAHPPADACDYARHCAALDFFALTDHAETLTPEHWQAEKESIRQCNDLAGDPANPDLVAFLGFEWTQVGATPETHYGHRCVIYPGLGDDELPARPISALADDQWDPDLAVARRGAQARLLDPLAWREYTDLLWLVDRIEAVPRCGADSEGQDLTSDCHENAATPDVLLEKLARSGLDVLVIPHGTTWGAYTPPTNTLAKQLTRTHTDPQRQPLIELMSGHGNSEQYRAWREFGEDESGNRVCPEPTADYLPCCWRAGEIMRERCGELSQEECDARVERAKQLAMAANVAPHLVFPDTEAEEWLDCGQCRDCFKPSFGYRPRGSVQYAMALSNPAERSPDGRPLRFRFGFVASSDNHSARPGTGFKQVDRHGVTDTVGARSAVYAPVVRGDRSVEDAQRPQPVPPEALGAVDAERQASFFYPGGLAAVHAEGRSRDAIWAALERRETYATSGPRILLWFDLLNEGVGPAPMGSEVALAENPRFEVRAIGARIQQPGCPEPRPGDLSPERRARLCRGECFHPGDARHPIVSIEVVRIRPQVRDDESIETLVADPWKTFACPPTTAGCVVRFEDEEFRSVRRDALYYVRALQEPTPAISAAGLRTDIDASGAAQSVRPCFGSYRTAREDDCLAATQERAWSSPIFVNTAR